jgi:uncharacterized membrane protein
VTELVVLVHLASTLYLTGLIWVIQLVHYPLMDRVPASRFDEFHAQHTRRISLVVIPPMLVELATAGWLAWQPPGRAPAGLTWIGLALLAVVWLSTFALQVPQHTRLSRGFEAAAHRRLVRGNWIRTAAWSLRAAVALAIAIMATG